MQGRFKRDGSASAEPEPRGGTDRGSSPQHAQNPGPAEVGGSGEHSARAGAKPKAPATTTDATKSATPGHGSRVALRNWRISTRLVSLLALPVVAATSLGALRINESMDNIQQLDNMRLLTEMTKQATELAAALQKERDESAGPLAHGALSNDYEVKSVRDATDVAKKHFLEGTQQVDDATAKGQLSGVHDSLVGVVSELYKLNQIRSDAYNDPQNATQTVDAYHRLVNELLALSQDMAEATSNPEMIQRTRALASFSAAKEYASVQRAVIAAALPTRPTTFGTLSKNDQQYALSAQESQESENQAFKNIYGSGSTELLLPIEGDNPTIKSADQYAKRVLSNPEGLKTQNKRSYRDWLDDDSSKIDQMSKIETTLLSEMEQKARELRNQSQSEAIISGVLILLVLGVSLVGAFVVARSMIRSLRRLQDTATRVAQDRLPELVKQLSESDPQDVDTSVESVGVHSRDEIGQVAAAFDDVHREAVRLAAEQALLRGNVNAMFTNLSRRSQGLIQRQLSLISELESREADPDQLSSLFKLDHLATRMRRNGENLLVLAGEEPGRRWTRPVPLVDVLRAAASEVEQYERIELASVPGTEVAGRVVNDLVHLLAELLENATSFSSPQTKVKVTGHALPDGRVLIEIHDTGIGLSPEDLAAINERLAAPPTVDVSVSRRMGLFVVGRLSQRHGIRIQLRPSDSGGTTALVMLPVDVAQGGKKPMPNKPGQGAGGGPAASQASAGVAAARRSGGPSLGTGSPSAPGGPLGAPPQRGQVGSGQGPRAALPGTGQGGRPGAAGGARGPQQGQGGQQGRQAPAGANAFGQSPQQGFPAQNGSQQQGFGDGAGSQNAFGDTSGGRKNSFGNGSGTGQTGQNAFGDSNQAPAAPAKASGGKSGRRRPQLPGRGGARAELPGGNTGSRTPSWSDDNAQPPVPRTSHDTPRGHEDPDATSRMPRVDDRQGPASTAEFARPDFDAPRPGAGAPQNNGQNNGQYGYGNQSSAGQNPAATGQFPAQGYGASQSPSSTGQFAQPGYAPSQDPASTGQFAAPGYGNGQGSSTGQYERPATPQAPARPQTPEALPPASNPGDGRTPLYDTLETNWFHGQANGSDGAPAGGAAQSNGTQSNGSQGYAQAAPQQPQTPPAPQRPAAAPATTSWRSSPNDDLVKQAERSRKPSAGGITTSGLPRRVPRANLVAGTAQQQQHQSGPQVSRAPDDVRGRLTNLRRGIQQGRQAGNGQTGSFPSPTHQQER
ncbi:nitrate- and nitrite sensing domain-containing protein [Streptomyces sp. NPDC059371]|uniref:nitrate- and nitrite sensing domain-containing protein n=1 Tax=Streptomyces sp. NPDC059371 TaxID=3346812 RepID=UPI0036BEE3CE